MNGLFGSLGKSVYICTRKRARTGGASVIRASSIAFSDLKVQSVALQSACTVLADRNKNDTYMNAVSMNNLWTYLQGLSLTASNRKWLAERLVEPENKEVMSDQEIKEGLTEAFSKLDGLKQGNVKTRSAEELLYEL
ncbi:MAG: hypothetical protein IJ804_01170 [Prevotella sp.]|nr:hypothetical protein [Prevotella sp.]